MTRKDDTLKQRSRHIARIAALRIALNAYREDIDGRKIHDVEILFDTLLKLRDGR